MKARHLVVGTAVAGIATFAASGIALGHTGGASCNGPNAVFAASQYGGASTHPRYVLDGGAPVSFVGSFTLTLPNASTPHSMVVKADDWADIPLSTPACVQPTTTTAAHTTTTTTTVAPTTTTEETTTSLPPSSSTTTPTSTVAPSTSTPASTTPTLSSTSSPATSGPPPSQPSVPPSTPSSQQPGEMCNTSSQNSDGATSSGCATPSTPSSPSTASATAPTSSTSATSSALPHTGADDSGTLALVACFFTSLGLVLHIVGSRRRGVR